MTEYEALDLQLQRWELLYQSEEIILLVITLYFTILFAYLAAAFFAGNKLSTSQALIGSAIFTAAAGFTVLQVYSYLTGLDAQGAAISQQYLEMASTFKNSAYASVANNLTRASTFDWSDAVIVSLMVTGILASLYFMWSVRHPRGQ